MRSILPTLALLVSAAPALAQAVIWTPESGEAPPPDVPTVVALTVDAAAEPEPALRYALYPKYADLQPGNAAPYYYRAIVQFTQTYGSIRAMPEEEREPLDVEFRSGEWIDLPLDEFPREKARRIVDTFSRVYGDLRTAVTREECHWDLRFRDIEGIDAIAFTLEEFQQMRGLARLLTLKARLEVVEGRHEDAIETCQTLYRMAHDVAEVPILINDLIGMAFLTITREQVEVLIGSPGSPNLYWALAQLPDPVIPMRDSMQQEALLGENIFPFLRNADIVERTDAEWDRVIREAAGQIDELAAWTGRARSPEIEVLADFAAAAKVAAGYREAKRRLIEAGHDADEVESMPVGRVVALDAQRTYRHTRDELFKWSLVPARYGWQRYRRADDRLKQEGYIGGGPGGRRELLPIASSLLPAAAAVAVAEVRVHRDLDGLRAIEALRMYAAEHGRFPASLADVTAVPVPDNPFTNAPFPYRVEAGKAILEVAAPEGYSPRAYVRVYELTLRAE